MGVRRHSVLRIRPAIHRPRKQSMHRERPLTTTGADYPGSELSGGQSARSTDAAQRHRHPAFHEKYLIPARWSHAQFELLHAATSRAVRAFGLRRRAAIRYRDSPSARNRRRPFDRAIQDRRLSSASRERKYFHRAVPATDCEVVVITGSGFLGHRVRRTAQGERWSLRGRVWGCKPKPPNFLAVFKFSSLPIANIRRKVRYTETCP